MRAMFEVPEVPAVAAVGAQPTTTVIERVSVLDKITDVAQLPSIWTLEQNIEWLIDEVIPLGSVNLITSESGVGKTWVAFAIAGAVARGEPFEVVA
jgi:RecA-family ATPase